MKKFIITFGFDQKDEKGKSLDHRYAIIWAKNKDEARDVAFEKFGRNWSRIFTSEASAGVHRFNLRLIEA